jgi:hypothetical protein
MSKESALVYSTNIWWNIYLFSNLVEHLSFCGHVVLVEEPLAVTSILVVKLKPWLAWTCRVIKQHYLRHNKNRNTNQLSDLNKILFSLKIDSN